MTDHTSKTPPKEKDYYQSPQYIYNWMDSIFEFDIDLAANKENAKLSTFIDEQADSLTIDWHLYAKTGWLNPPYSDIKPWVRKAALESSHGFTTVMLIPTPNGEKIYRNIFYKASEIIFINGRLAFIDVNGKPKSGNTRGSCIVIFTPLGGKLRLSHINRDELKERFQ